MDKVLVKYIDKYIDNNSIRYDGKEYLELVSQIRRDENQSGPLKIGEFVTIKTKSRLWKAVVINLELNPPHKKRRKSGRKSDVLQSPEVPMQNLVVMASFTAAPDTVTQSPQSPTTSTRIITNVPSIQSPIYSPTSPTQALTNTSSIESPTSPIQTPAAIPLTQTHNTPATQPNPGLLCTPHPLNNLYPHHPHNNLLNHLYPHHSHNNLLNHLYPHHSHNNLLNHLYPHHPHNNLLNHLYPHHPHNNLLNHLYPHHPHNNLLNNLYPHHSHNNLLNHLYPHHSHNNLLNHLYPHHPHHNLLNHLYPHHPHNNLLNNLYPHHPHHNLLNHLYPHHPHNNLLAHRLHNLSHAHHPYMTKVASVS